MNETLEVPVQALGRMRVRCTIPVPTDDKFVLGILQGLAMTLALAGFGALVALLA